MTTAPHQLAVEAQRLDGTLLSRNLSYPGIVVRPGTNYRCDASSLTREHTVGPEVTSLVAACQRLNWAQPQLIHKEAYCRCDDLNAELNQQPDVRQEAPLYSPRVKFI